jgi:hypothetical protein
LDAQLERSRALVIEKAILVVAGAVFHEQVGSTIDDRWAGARISKVTQLDIAQGIALMLDHHIHDIALLEWAKNGLSHPNGGNGLCGATVHGVDDIHGRTITC